MLDGLNLDQILFLDIETVSEFSSYNELDKAKQNFWDRKANYIATKEDKTPEEVYGSAAIYAEFGKIICITVGYFSQLNKGNRQFRLKSFYSHDEEKLLLDFCNLLNSYFNKPTHLLCAHNGKEFDFPYIARRLLINKIKLPDMLNIAGKKPWEIKHLDTMELWKFGDYKNYTSIGLLAHLFNIPTPKDDIDGSMVGHVYWKENDLDRIELYCRKDVITVAQILLSYKREPILNDDEIIVI